LNQIRVLLLGMIIMVISVACGGGDSASANPTAVDVQNVDTNDTANTVPTTDTITGDGIASVNGVSITQEQFDRAFVRIAGNSTAADNSALAVQVLNTLIEQEVITQSAAGLGVTVSDADIDAEITSLQQGLGDTSWEDWLLSNQYTEAEFRKALLNSITTNRVRDKVIAQLGEKVEHVHARHILVKTEDEAKSVLDRLAGGEDFVSLAASLSLDVTTRDFGGDLGWFIREELLDVTLAEAAFSSEAGQITGPVITRLGYHILQTLEKEERNIEPERMPLLVENVFNQWLEEELLSATVTRKQ
jgi:foldase protein PrsA